MPHINDYVIYSTHGVCKIEDLRFIKFDSCTSGHDYYILKPIARNTSSLFVPADNPALVARMRPVLSKEEIDHIILSVKDQNLLWIDDPKQRSARFQEILRIRDERELLLMISCLYLKSIGTEKGLSNTDAQVLKKAESIIDQEFAFSLKISTSSIKHYLREKLGLNESRDTGAIPVSP